MSIVNSVSEDVDDLMKEIISKHNLDPNSKIIYSTGAADTDGFMSKTVVVDIVNDKKPLYLFVKYSLNVKSALLPLDKLYATERHFYNVIYPEYKKFIESRGVTDALEDVPTCVGVSKKNVVAMENLRKKGFEMYETLNPMNENHISGVFKSMARFHAICFAFRDQNEEKYEEIAGHLTYFYDQPEKMLEFGLALYSRFLEILDPVKDKLILDHRENVTKKLFEYFQGSGKTRNQYSILTKGDCWSSNMMFRYENGNKENPADIALLDWQTPNVDSVVKDLSHFFYTSAAKEDLKRLNYYLKIYHDELSTYIKRLGSDPEEIFPFSALEEEWRQHSRFGYGLGIMFLHVMIAPKEDVFDKEKMHSDDLETMYTQAKLYPEYIRRLKDLTVFCIENNFV